MPLTSKMSTPVSWRLSLLMPKIKRAAAAMAASGVNLSSAAWMEHSADPVDRLVWQEAKRLRAKE